MVNGPSLASVSGAMSDHEELRGKLRWRGPAPVEGRFLSVFMDQNNRCNLKCRMCGFSDARVDSLAKYDMPRWLFDAIAFQLFPRANHVVLSLMTEPFMTRDFPDRLGMVRLMGVPFSDIITNGTLLGERAIEKVLEARITRLTFSIDGGTRETFEGIRVGARFDVVMRNLRLFLAMRKERRGETRLRINHVLSEQNIDRFDDFMDLVATFRPDEFAVRTVSRMSDAEIQEPHDPEFWAKVAAVKKEMNAFAARIGIPHSGYLRETDAVIDLLDEAGERMICRTPWDTLAIHPTGDVFPCMAWSRPPVGNLATQSFEEIWNGAALAELRREFESVRPGVDCLNCTIRRDAGDERDDFFYRKLAAPAASRN